MELGVRTRRHTCVLGNIGTCRGKQEGRTHVSTCRDAHALITCHCYTWLVCTPCSRQWLSSIPLHLSGCKTQPFSGFSNSFWKLQPANREDTTWTAKHMQHMFPRGTDQCLQPEAVKHPLALLPVLPGAEYAA